MRSRLFIRRGARLVLCHRIELREVLWDRFGRSQNHVSTTNESTPECHCQQRPTQLGCPDMTNDSLGAYLLSERLGWLYFALCKLNIAYEELTRSTHHN